MPLNSIVSRVPMIEITPSKIQETVYKLLKICGREYLMADVMDFPIRIQSDRGHHISPQCIPI